ncbi:hypothetical protein NCLIV_037020 [Neospora caninum Liverpool]|uniref:CRAL/TRIO domain-containing protein n=1 Tax=Neospora caninum (strain Liverpool) TaxID=572307 RepID=F0VJK9_NEOCL|nr:hypothetical protein NCLIV_037020 [Neospora caninum Liverpool]CBZ53920.1 hypothetical protein NCLIV_037020 [Neospora caninum Liverpool]|eukprot:XP_003883952.1 hypothetical protein NCLIV_037020 [Neospora caninum Liverpool]
MDGAHARARSAEAAEDFTSAPMLSRSLNLTALQLPAPIQSPTTKTPHLSPLSLPDKEEGVVSPGNFYGCDHVDWRDERAEPPGDGEPALDQDVCTSCRSFTRVSQSKQALAKGCGLQARPNRTLSFTTEPFVAVTLDLSPLVTSQSSPPSPMPSPMADGLRPLGSPGTERRFSAAPERASHSDLSPYESSLCDSSPGASSSSSSPVSPDPASLRSAPNLPSWSSSASSSSALDRVRKNSGNGAGETWGACVPRATETDTKGSLSAFLHEPLPPFFLQSGPTPERVEALYQFIEIAHDIRRTVLSEMRASSRPRSGSTGDLTAAQTRSGEIDAQAPEELFSLEVAELAGTYRLFRFLQGYDFDVNEAAIAYRRHVMWRISQKIDTAMRDYILREMVLPLSPETAVGHAAVSRNFPNNQLLRTSAPNQAGAEEGCFKTVDGNEERSETVSTELVPCSPESRACSSTTSKDQATNEGAGFSFVPETNTGDESKGVANRGDEEEVLFCRLALASSTTSSSTSASSSISTSSLTSSSSSPDSSVACMPSGCSKEFASPPESFLSSVASTHKPEILLDREGNIITVARPGLLDERRLFEELSEDLFLKWHCYQLEFRNILLDRHVGGPAKKLLVSRLRNLPRLLCATILRQLIYVTSENYPESLSHIFFINTPRLFSAVWGTLQGWLKERTVSKIHLLESDYATELHKYIDPASLPPSLGGICTSPLAGIRTYSKVELLSARLGGGHSILQIGARRREQVQIEVPQGHCLSWAWVLFDHDVCFQVKWRPEAGGEERSILDMKKHQGNQVVRGSMKADEDGTVSLVFDNSWGLFSSRTVFYKAQVSTLNLAVVEEVDVTEDQFSSS